MRHVNIFETIAEAVERTDLTAPQVAIVADQRLFSGNIENDKPIRFVQDGNTVSIQEVISYPGLRFKSIGSTTVALTYGMTVNGVRNNPDIKYSLDGGNTWTQWVRGSDDKFPAISLSNNDVICFKGNNPNGFSSILYSRALCSIFVFGGDGFIEAYGNIMSLLDDGACNTYDMSSMRSCCFWRLFSGCTKLLTAPELPATILAQECYEEMFYGCTSLTVAPEMLANTLANYCCWDMFGNSGVTNVEFKGNITTIPYMSMRNIVNGNVTLPNSITSIDTYAFDAGEDWSITNIVKSITINGTTYDTSTAESIDVTLSNGTTVTIRLWRQKVCFMEGTQITLADGTTKAVEDIQYTDNLKVWNFDDGHYDTAYPLWITKRGELTQYYKITLNDGTVLNVAGANTGHKIYNVDEHKFEGCVNIKVGTHVYTETGIKEIVNKEIIEEHVYYYNLMTDRHINCFAEGILTSMRYNSIYPFSSDMKFVKDERELRPYSEFEAVGISRYWYDGLRLAEQTDSVEKIRSYVINLESKMLPRE